MGRLAWMVLIGMTLTTAGCGDACEQLCMGVKDAFDECAGEVNVTDYTCYEDADGAYTGGNPAFRDCDDIDDFVDDCLAVWASTRDVLYADEPSFVEASLEACRLQGEAADGNCRTAAASPISLF